MSKSPQPPLSAWAGEDVRRLLESRFDLGAAPTLRAILTTDAQRNMLDEAAAELSQRREALREAAAQNAGEATETTDATTAAKKATETLRERYTHIRGQARTSLLEPDPDANVPPETIASNRKLYKHAFTASPSKLFNLGFDRQLSLIEPTVLAIAKDTTLSAFDPQQRLARDYRAAEVAVTRWTNERKDDVKSTRHLEKCREMFDASDLAYTLQVESFLVRFSRKDEAGDFLKSKDAAYAARRRAKANITEEPDAPNAIEPLTPQPNT
jgi:hypothetical protein